LIVKLLLVPYLAAHLVVGAPTEVEIHIMPPGSPVVSDGVRFQGFTFNEYKLLLQMDNELHLARKQIKLVGDLELQFEAALQAKDQVIVTLRQDVETYETRSERLDGKWKKCEEDLVEVSGGSWVPWVIAGVGAAIGILGAGLFIGSELKN